MKEAILKSIHECIDATRKLSEPQSIQFIEDAATMISSCLAGGNKVLIAGNGGSLSDATHFAEELTGYFRKHRRALPAIAISDPAHITCTANDTDFSQVFARGIEALGVSGDVFIGLSTSGNSENIVKAMELAKSLEMKTIAFLGKGGGKLRGYADLELCIDGFPTSDRIQEAHMASMHVIIEIIEYKLFQTDEVVSAESLSAQ